MWRLDVGPGVQIFAFCEQRDHEALEAFAKTFVAPEELREERPIKAILLEGSVSWLATPLDQWLTFKNVAEAFDYGVEHRQAAFTFYLDAKKGLKATHTMVTFTLDKHIVFGLALPLGSANLAEDERIIVMARKLLAATRAGSYAFGVDLAPPVNRAEYAAMGAHF